tara:strand:+ start:242 stop:559 length:318 start_codon:yes stop_codon:yes gene_type:complete
MKNLFFALAFMLVGTFAFANNAKEVTTVNYDVVVKSLKSTDFSDNLKIENSLGVFGTCEITITFVNGDGEETGSISGTIPNVDSQEQCDAIADAVKKLIDTMVNQ